jgi:hypothetical protein
LSPCRENIAFAGMSLLVLSLSPVPSYPRAPLSRARA